MDAHWVQIFNRADHHKIIYLVAQHFQLVFFPADQRFFHPGLLDGRGVQGFAHRLGELAGGMHPRSPTAAQCEGGAHQQRVPASFRQRLGLGQRVRRPAQWNGQPSGQQRVAEQGAVFGDANRVEPGPDQLDAVAGQNAVLAEFQRQVEPGLAADGGQHGVRPFLRDNGFQRLKRQRFDIGGFGQIRVGHDGGRVGIDQHHAAA